MSTDGNGIKVTLDDFGEQLKRLNERLDSQEKALEVNVLLTINSTFLHAILFEPYYFLN